MGVCTSRRVEVNSTRGGNYHRLGQPTKNLLMSKNHCLPAKNVYSKGSLAVFV
jgi:FAD synthase